MYKLLISDFEDTLIDEEDAIPLSTVLEIDKIRNNKVLFGIFTKRNFKSILEYNKDFPIVDYIIALDGSYIYDVKKDKPLFKRNVAISIVKKIKKVFDEYNLCFYTLEWCNFTKEKVEGDNVRKIGDFKVFSEFHRDNIFKVEIRCKNRKEQTEALKILEDLNLDIEFYSRNDKLKGHFIEIVGAECNRLDAINRICRDKHIGIKDTLLVCQDDDNLALIKKVGFSVCVENSSSKVKKACKDITTSNLDKGVEKVIAKYFS